MLAWIVYSMATFGGGLILAFVLSMLTGGIGKKAEKPYRIVIACLLLTMGGPFAYVEYLTRTHGHDLEHAIKVCYDDVPINGPMMYYKVVSYGDSKATALIVGREPFVQGMTDRPIAQVALVKDEDGWRADSYKMIYSYKLNKDGIDFPPYQ